MYVVSQRPLDLVPSSILPPIPIHLAAASLLTILLENEQGDVCPSFKMQRA